MYILDTSTYYIYQYDLDTAFDVDTAEYNGSFYSNISSPQSILFNNDGTKFFVLTNTTLTQYTVETAFDVSSTLTSSGTTYLNGQDAYMRGITFNNDGTKIFAVGSQYDKVYEYDLSTAFDTSSTSLAYNDVSYSISSEQLAPTDIKFNHDGTKMYISGTNDSNICLLYTSPSPRDTERSRMPSSA